MIPVNSPFISAEAWSFIKDALGSGWISSGKYVERFGREFAEYAGCAWGVANCNGTASLHLALSALGVGPGDEVIVPAQTIVSCLNAVLYLGAVPVIVDVDPEIYTLDPTLLASAITTSTKVIMAVHLFGHPCDMDAIYNIARKNGVAVLEDASQAHGALYKGEPCGSFGDLSTFSFYANKLITTGEGGMVCGNDAKLRERLLSLRDLSHIPGQRFHHEVIGYNYRMSNVLAALGCGQMLHKEELLERKLRMARMYEQGLSGILGLVLPTQKSWAQSSYWMYAVRVTGMSRDEFRKKLWDLGVDTRDFFWSLSEQPMLKNYSVRVLPCPVSEKIAHEGCYLPSGLALTDGEIGEVVKAVRTVMGIL